MSICAALNFGHDAATLPRLIRSVRGLVDGVVACDTRGDVKASDALICACDDADMPLMLGARPWDNYAYSQTALLKLAKRAGYTWAWVFDADEEVVCAKTIRLADADAYDVCRIYSGDWEVWTPRIFRLRERWRYLGERHAQPYIDNRPTRLHRLEGVDVLHHGDDAAHSAERFARDAESFAYQANKAEGAVRSRAAYYAAQSYYDAWKLGGGCRELAIYWWRERLCEPEGFDEERYISALQLARHTRNLEWFWLALDLRPHRFEARVELAQELLKMGHAKRALDVLSPCATLGPSGDRFLVRRSDEQWRWAQVMQDAHMALEVAKEAT